MGESLKHFISRRNIQNFALDKKRKTKNIPALKELWSQADSRSSDIAFIRSRFFSHTELFSFYEKYRNFVRNFFRTGTGENNTYLFFDENGNFKNRKGSAFFHFISMRLLQHDITARETLPWFIISLSLFIAATAAGYGIVTLFSSYGEFFLPPDVQKSLARGELWTNILTNSPVSGGTQIIANNIFVTIKAFGLGIFFGLPSLLIVLFNGWHLGSIFAATTKFQMHTSLLQFVLNHGVLELTITVFAGALGLRTGISFFALPGGSRLAHFISCFWDSFNSIVICSLWLFVCGIIESQLSPHMANAKPHSIMIPVSLSIGIGLLLVNLLFHHGVKRHGSRKNNK
jgi:uncharacterized membrane protein SpoIIM required for sporulation